MTESEKEVIRFNNQRQRRCPHPWHWHEVIKFYSFFPQRMSKNKPRKSGRYITLANIICFKEICWTASQIEISVKTTNLSPSKIDTPYLPRQIPLSSKIDTPIFQDRYPLSSKIDTSYLPRQIPPIFKLFDSLPQLGVSVSKRIRHRY